MRGRALRRVFTVGNSRGVMTSITTTPDDAGANRNGIICALIAYLMWGTYAAFFALLAHVNALEVVAHRAFWSIPIAAAVMLVMGRTQDVLRVVKTPKLLGLMCLTTLLVTISWGVFVWAVAVGRALETSLAFYINPLLNVAVGYLVLREKMTGLQFIAIGLAVTGVAYQTWALGAFPWLSLLLGAAFSAYGFLRKTIDVGPVQGFFVESFILSVLGLAVVSWLGTQGPLAFGSDWNTTALLLACGPMTALPLMFFATAARRIRFSTLGLLQYIAPSMLFLTAVFVLNEPMQPAQLVTFGFIWTALALYSFSSLRQPVAS
ncbi:MAG: EamA family transporter RarD [Anderseniella sp.]